MNFLSIQLHVFVSDHIVATLISQNVHTYCPISRIQSPEVTETRKVIQAFDVYSFGDILLEEVPYKLMHTTSSDEVIHFVRCVHSIVREDSKGLALKIFGVGILDR